ncbi:hypothetical protein M5D96_002353 [Drosophila gunungcola]|uniref:Uncharacterized protein n=1 Tax=Drosophila gunungcola TaxID=103775 RepID=A0A9P9Z0B3_9MUSC|nr:hypothetical protein M5D96_002353 [Drosophila gunungcola]
MDNWNVLAAQTSSQAIGLHDSGTVKTRLGNNTRFDDEVIFLFVHHRVGGLGGGSVVLGECVSGAGPMNKQLMHPRQICHCSRY